MRVIRAVFARSCLGGLVAIGSLALVGCGDQPDTGAQQKATPEEVQQRGQGIKDAMKSGMYDMPKQPQAK